MFSCEIYNQQLEVILRVHMLPLRQKKKTNKKNVQVLSYLVIAMTGITPANRAYENCTIGALSYYWAKTGHLELLVYRNSSTGHGLQSYRPSKKIYLMRAATSYHLWFCPSPREWLLMLLRRVKAKVIGDLFSFFPWCLQAASKTNLFF